MSVKKKYLDPYLLEVYKQFIAIKDDDFKRAQEVFKGVFDQVKQKMGEQCNFFQKYSNQVMYAGSVYDGIKVSKMDEFDMDIVIRLPVPKEGEHAIILENADPGFVKMKIIKAFDDLDNQPEWEKCHKVTREWRDSEKYFLQNKFRQWMHGIVQRAVNEMNHRVEVNGDTYLLTYKESGPAYTLNVRGDGFLLDVDLVPVIRFISNKRWPQGYKSTGRTPKDWLVVPKPIKGAPDETTKNRCWRLSFQEFERDMMKGCQALKMTIRLLKKLRDSLEMKAIASYYIKTLFLWKVEKEDKSYWQNKVSVTFQDMVGELHTAIKDKKIKYFWSPKNNLIETLKPTVQQLYLKKLENVLDNIQANNVEEVALLLLSVKEREKFRKSDFFVKQQELPIAISPLSAASASTEDSSQSWRPEPNSLHSQIKQLNEKMEQMRMIHENQLDELRRSFDEKVEALNEKFYNLNEKYEQLCLRNNLNGAVEDPVNNLVAEASLLDLDDFERVKRVKVASKSQSGSLTY